MNLPSLGLSSTSVAIEFISIAGSCGFRITHLKLQKLVYNACGWYMCAFNETLIDELILAHMYGPILITLYHKYKYEPECCKMGYDTVDTSIPTRAKKLIKVVWDVHCNWTETQMSVDSRVTDGPWHKAFMRGDMYLKNEDILSHFRGMQIKNSEKFQEEQTKKQV